MHNKNCDDVKSSHFLLDNTFAAIYVSETIHCKSRKDSGYQNRNEIGKGEGASSRHSLHDFRFEKMAKLKEAVMRQIEWAGVVRECGNVVILSGVSFEVVGRTLR